MNILETSIQGIFIVENEGFSDTRGSFSRLFCNQELNTILKQRQIVQINQSITIKTGSIRGLHFQHPPHAEMKFIRCLKGKVFDVAVDIRQGSETFLKWHAQILTPEKNNMLVIPEGCAHGFQTLEPDTELLYFHTAHYKPEHEGGISFDDKEISINWPIPFTDISERDKQLPEIDKKFSGLAV